MNLYFKKSVIRIFWVTGIVLLVALSVWTVWTIWNSQSQQYHPLSAVTQRNLTAVLVVIAYLLFCAAILQQHRRRIAIASATFVSNISSMDVANNVKKILVVHASQTGYAEQLARQTAQSLQAGGMAVELLSIAQINASQLQQAERILFVVSTTGEGDAPDSAAGFARKLMSQTLAITQLRYGILALGDRSYQHYCAFGHRLEHWLRHNHAQTLFDLIEVDNGDEGALRHWQHHLGVLSGHTELADWTSPGYSNWILTERRLLNPGSAGSAAFHITLRPDHASGTELPLWQAGDIVEIGPEYAPDDTTPATERTPLPHREYSIASIHSDGQIELLVRQMQQANGKLGIGSGWLTAYAQVGGKIAVRLRENRSFHPPTDAMADRPMILIGNGTGLAGLRAHIKHRASLGYLRNYLFFGERNRAFDYFHQEEIEAWKTKGVLQECHLAFSRDQGQRVYVQDRLLDNANAIQEWIKDGAAIYVCGSLAGMAAGVDAALNQILGENLLEQLTEEGRYRRDVY
ncbi:sulfite reductase (NADPH) flavoprotein alpha-component [Undibacterium sp. GrIS 1.8]|uniref:sulfite reductase subunit alpha n=1 Tax=Undibacterium sp. GrIS 1.8 TaxID=3143934 RepID=UPI00339B9BCA